MAKIKKPKKRMAHPSNEPGKTYDLDDRRRAAAVAACEGIPTEWLERGFIAELYKTMALVSLCDHMAERKDGDVRHPERERVNDALHGPGDIEK